jgi:hypothetical protein
MLGMDCAASEFYDSSTQRYDIGSKSLTGEELGKLYLDLIRDFPIVSIEVRGGTESSAPWPLASRLCHRVPRASFSCLCAHPVCYAVLAGPVRSGEAPQSCGLGRAGVRRLGDDTGAWGRWYVLMMRGWGGSSSAGGR